MAGSAETVKKVACALQGTLLTIARIYCLIMTFICVGIPGAWW